MSPRIKRRIGEILIEDGLLTQAKLEEALAHQKEKGGLIGQILVELKFVDEDTLISALGKQYKIPYLPLKNYSINPDMAEILKADFCHENTLVAFDCDSKKVFVAVGDPHNMEAVEKIQTLTERVPQVFLSKISEILNAIYFLYHEAP
ncbi:MAG TPA: hypothetical protein PLL75_07335 [Candidatus Omnitrophota bacterium]|nr:hypothetical protein [Candidatus Omnitrophota bacterium]HPS37519.1 hypothetical protein [Candidatus Omnitrophota bacterium]